MALFLLSAHAEIFFVSRMRYFDVAFMRNMSLSAHVERFSVSRSGEFYLLQILKTLSEGKTCI